MAQPVTEETPVDPVAVELPVPIVPAPFTHVIPEGTGFSAVLRNRAFLAVWSAQVMSQTAQNAVWYCLIILISFLTGGNVLSVGGIIIMVQLPTVLFSSVSGVLVDRVSKKMILISTNAIRTVAVGGYLFFSGSVEALYVITFLVAVVSQPFQPAEGSTIPILVNEDQLITANSLFQGTFMASQIIGFGLAALLFGTVGRTVTFIVLMAMFGYSAAILVLLPAATSRTKPVEESGIVRAAEAVWTELLEGAQSIWRDRRLLIALIQIAFAPTLLLLIAQVAPAFVKQVLDINNPDTIILVLAPAGVGMGIGLLVLGHWGARIRKDRLVVVALLALSLTILGMADVPSLAHEFWLPFTVIGVNPSVHLSRLLTMLPISLLLGIEIAFINAPLQTILQERAPEEQRGRVLGMQQTVTAALAIPPLLIIGGIGTAVGVQGSLGLVGVILFLVALASVYGI